MGAGGLISQKLLCLLFVAGFLSIQFWPAEAKAEDNPEPESTASAVMIDLPTNPALGSKLFVEKRCDQCHSVRGHGAKFAPDLARIQTGATFLDIAADMWNHSPRMEEEFVKLGFVRPELSPDDVSALISFLYLLNFFDEQGEVQAGEALFRTKGCSSCHQVGGANGDLAGPDLNHFAEYRSSVFIVTALWNRLKDMKAMQDRRGIHYPNFSGKELTHLIAYIRDEGSKASELSYWRYIRPGNPKKGAMLFLDKGCADCHSASSGAEAKVGPDLQTKELWGSLTAIGSTLWNHGPAMWEQAQGKLPEFEPKEMLDLLIYLYFIKYVDPPGNPVVGKKLFEERSCSDCHTVGQGDSTGPDMLTLWGGRTPADIVSQMWNHSGKMVEMVQEEDRAWPRLEDKELADLLAYVEQQRAAKKGEN
jgi:cytochrome c2